MPDTTTLSRYLKPEHVQDGDMINFMDAGTIEEKTFERNGKKEKGNILELNVVVKGQKKIYSPNSQSLKFLNGAWGTQTESWIGKQARVTIGLSNNGQNIIIAKPVVAESAVANGG